MLRSFNVRKFGMWDIGTLHVTSLHLVLVLIPKSIPTELSVLGNTSGKTFTTKLRKCRLAESFLLTRFGMILCLASIIKSLGKFDQMSHFCINSKCPL